MRWKDESGKSFPKLSNIIMSSYCPGLLAGVFRAYVSELRTAFFSRTGAYFVFILNRWADLMHR